MPKTSVRQMSRDALAALEAALAGAGQSYSGGGKPYTCSVAHPSAAEHVWRLKAVFNPAMNAYTVDYQMYRVGQDSSRAVRGTARHFHAKTPDEAARKALKALGLTGGQ